MNELGSSVTVQPVGTFYEFFAGGGMARAGLGNSWECLFANDIDEKKLASYARNWGSDELEIGDIAGLSANDLPGMADLAWASFPCQDLSLAGAGAGLDGARSGTFWPFWKLIKELLREGRAPKLIVLENVCGALTSHEGRDFQSIVRAIGSQEYRLGALIMDAARFVPQSRPRLFLIAVRDDLPFPDHLFGAEPVSEWCSDALIKAHGSLSANQKAKWLWWQMPVPVDRPLAFSDLIEQEPRDVCWHTKAETSRVLELMSPINRKKVDQALKTGRRKVGTIYKRTRDGVQRAEVRFDEIAGCLRTPVGGSSRQLVLIAENNRIYSRLLSAREAARLMGLHEDYTLPENYNEAYHLIGDGLVVPVVSWLERHLLRPLLQAPEENVLTIVPPEPELVHA